MSLAQEALAKLEAAESGVGSASGRVARAMAETKDVRDDLGRSFTGSANPRAEESRRLLRAATDAMTHAAVLLARSGDDVRDYMAEAFGTATGGPSGAATAVGPESPPPDPSQPGALGRWFVAGVHDPAGLFNADERRTAERLAAFGASVHPRLADHGTKGVPNPDSMVRWSPADRGRITELKTMAPSGKASDRTVQRSIRDAVAQVRGRGGGEAVVDASDTPVDGAIAGHAFRRFAGEAKSRPVYVPRRVFVLLREGEMIDVVSGRMRRVQ